MKHVKLFEAFGQEKGPFLIGYYSDGGFGSHPAIFSKEHLIELGWRNEAHPAYIANPNFAGGNWNGPNGTAFFSLEETPTLPKALLCGFSPDVEWDIKPISDPSMVQKIREILKQFGEIDPLWRNEDYIQEDDLEYGEGEQTMISDIVDEISNMADILDTARPGERSVTLVPVNSPNTIYWSPEPEQSHGYWKPPYGEMSLQDLGYGEDEQY